ncbi:MAG: ABC transporter transmembrane domain-containing protein, partial [Ruminococcus flavefaciens]|nr:ABC transporter transmembrane domain-containing protein [Ruminococcus flavefaciens]
MYQNLKTLMLMLKQLATILNKEQRRKCYGVFLVILAGSMTEMLGVGALLPFLQSILNPAEVSQRWYGRILMDVFGVKNANTLFIILGIGVVILYIVKNIVLLLSAYEQNKLSTGITQELSTSMLNSYMKRSYEFFLEHNSADMIRGVDGDALGVYNIIANMFVMVTEILKCSLIGIFLMVIDFP